MSKDLESRSKNPLDTTFSSETISVNDIVMPKLWLLQGLSEMVSDGNAKLGDLADSLTKEVLGGFDKSVNFVPITFKKLWYKTRGRELLEVMSVTPENENLPFEEAGGIKNSRAIIFYGLVGDNALPYTINFKGTSFMAGKQLLTQAFVMSQMVGKQAYETSFEIGSVKRSNDQGTFAVLTAKQGKAAKKEQIEKAKMWGRMIEASKAQTPVVKPDPTNHVDEDISF